MPLPRPGATGASRPRPAHLRPSLPRRRAAVVSALAVALGLAPVLGLAIGTRPATAGIGSDKTKITQLEQRIAAQGNHVQSLVERSDEVATQLMNIESQMKSDRAALVSDRKNEHQATLRLRSWAINAYVNAVSGNSNSIPIFSATGAATLPAQEAYLGIASGNVNTAVNQLQNDEHRILSTEERLHVEQQQTTSTLRQLLAARQAADSGIYSEDATLRGVKSNLLALVNAQNEEQEEAEEEQSEQQLAAQAAQQGANTATPTVAPTAGSYANPLRAVAGLGPERIDQGVDYRGYGPIYAIGDGVVLSLYNGGWPGGTFICYRLTDGPAAGLVVYAAEDIEPTVSIGQSVTANTVLGQMYEGSDGIETGWADPAADGETLAADNQQFYGSNSTAFGANFSSLLESVGAPGGIPQNAPTGSLPADWPQW